MAKFQFEKLLELARQDEDKAARTMQDAQKRLNQSQQQFQTLGQYRQDYLDKLGQTQSQGITIAQLKDYQLFMSKLDTAIQQQQKEVERYEQILVAARNQWMEKRSKVQAFEALEVRHHANELKKENKQEQKLNDEFAGRAGRHTPENG
ncbi:flagellar export protein FliJ [Leeia sp. TBRC 13508]|uniref:Flagellar FliJ protein n=1 Tax=Leeia speluncae TaxID=2884804 RepID=A0ABS8DAK6_9NEIS|nr:flagellar export protein FliJ [Leeia speluncae]MCB6185242.1 flagellar export protein FliJ [Leeia speluncae]